MFPQITGDSIYFSLKVHHGGFFTDNFEEYTGNNVDYFDMCSVNQFCMVDVESMLSDLGLKLGGYDLWSCIPENKLSQGILEVENEDQLEVLVDLLVYGKCMVFYTTERAEGEGWDEF